MTDFSLFINLNNIFCFIKPEKKIPLQSGRTKKNYSYVTIARLSKSWHFSIDLLLCFKDTQGRRSINTWNEKKAIFLSLDNKCKVLPMQTAGELRAWCETYSLDRACIFNVYVCYVGKEKIIYSTFHNMQKITAKLYSIHDLISRNADQRWATNYLHLNKQS